MVDANDLAARRCRPCEGEMAPLEGDAVTTLLAKLDEHWALAADGRSISRAFKFPGYLRTISFVNAVAWIAERENHHPDLNVRFGRVEITYTTHAINGLSENDFICAAKIDRL